MTRRHALLLAAVVAVAALALTATGAVQAPDLERLLTDLSDTLGTWTYALIGGLAFLETGAFVGLVAPGETAIVLGGVVAAQGRISLALVLAVAWAGAALGDLASLLLGRRLGRRFLLARGPRLGVTAARLESVERFYARHGAKAILIGRFIGIVRAVSPFLAGASGLRTRAFVPWSVLGTGVWVAAYALVGYAFHRSFASAGQALTYGALGLAAVAALVLALRARRPAQA